MERLESMPLVGSYMASIELHENIYSFVILFSTMHRHKHGHSFTPGAVVAFLLFALNVVLQLALTTIAGGYILATDRIFINEVLPVELQPSLLYMLSEPWTAFTSKATDTLTVLESEANRRFNLTEALADCCVGADCAYLGTECCPPGVKAGGVRTSPAKMLQTNVSRHLSWKPSGKGNNAKGRMDDSGEASFRSSGPLCSLEMGQMDCTQPTFKYIDAWDELDADGDGKWTVEEAQEDLANLGCRYGLAPHEVFRSVCRGVALDIVDTGEHVGTTGEKFQVPPGISSCTSITKQYFEYWKGLVAICAAPGRDQCGQLILYGAFDGLLLFGKEGLARGGAVDLDSALDYCQRILTASGLCDRMLPVTYTMHMHRLRDKCGEANYAANLRYHSPVDHTDVIGLVTVDYANLRQYTAARGVTFNMFVACILFVWYLTLIRELKAIMWLADFSWNFPGTGEPRVTVKEMMRQIVGNMRRSVRETAEKIIRTDTGGRTGTTESSAPADTSGAPRLPVQARASSAPAAGAASAAATQSADLEEQAATNSDVSSEEDTEQEQDTSVPAHGKTQYGAGEGGPIILENITREMRCMCFAVVAVRFWLMWYMGIVGTIFTLSTYSYDELLMNAVALAFIFELPELLFMLLVSSRHKKELDALGPLVYHSRLAQLNKLQRFFLSRYFWGLIIIPIICYIIVANNHKNVIVPMQEALECACLQTGERCHAAQHISRHWWAEYWSLHATWPREVWLWAARGA